MERQIIKNLDKKIFGIAIDAGSGLKKALKRQKRGRVEGLTLKIK